jgi:hypothetical protein
MAGMVRSTMARATIAAAPKTTAGRRHALTVDRRKPP